MAKPSGTSDRESTARLIDYQTPFDNPTGDVVLRSSDSLQFRTHRVVLGLASPIFKDPKIDNLDQLRLVVDALILKYDVQFVVPGGKMYLEKYTARNPLGVFAVAYLGHLVNKSRWNEIIGITGLGGGNGTSDGGPHQIWTEMDNAIKSFSMVYMLASTVASSLKSSFSWSIIIPSAKASSLDVL
ncbi:hypothetical protein C8R43DRAFT_957601 [Mycena crocata]|nr:hypothetical protein C8R43DRAFT_957601 [Mycena crocata]